MIVHLNGWPGVGKRTIGEIVARELGATFVHNHLLHDVAIVCAGLHGNERWPLYEIVRAAAYDPLAKRPPGEMLVMTNALCRGASREVQAWHHVVDLAIARHSPLVPVVLYADMEELCRRVQSQERVGHKLSDATELREMLPTDTIQEPDVPELLVLDVTALSAEQAAVRVLQHVGALRGSLPPATERHRELRSHRRS